MKRFPNLSRIPGLARIRKNTNLRMNPENYPTDANRTVQFHGVQISGSLGPNVVVETDGISARNIASGEGAGDIYQVRANDRDDVTLASLLSKLNEQMAAVPPERLEELHTAITQAWNEVAKGQKANLNLLWMVFNYVREVAAPFLPRLIEGLGFCAQRFGAPLVAELAKRFR